MTMLNTKRRSFVRNVGVVAGFIAGAMLSSTPAWAQTNLAVNQPINASSFTDVYPATNANDGNQSSYWESQNNAFPQTLTADLGAVTSVQEIALTLPSQWGSRTQTLSVRGSTDGNTYSDLVAANGYTFEPANNNEVTIDLGGVQTRYVRLHVTGNTGWPAAQFSELKIFGDASSSPINAFDRIQAEAYSAMNGIQTEATTDAGGGQNIGWIDNGDWVRFDNVDFADGAYRVDARVASNHAGGTIEFRLDDPAGELIASVAAGNTGGWQNWVTESANTFAQGQHDLYLVFTGSGTGGLFNLNWVQFSAGDDVTLPAIPDGLTVTETTQSSVSLSWNSAADASGYEVLRDGSVLADVSGTGYQDVGLSAETSYQYRVRAYNDFGTSGESAAVTATTQADDGGGNPDHPEPNDEHGANMPYDRYDTDSAQYGGGALLKEAPNFDQSLTASEASGQRYIALPSNGAYAEWTIRQGEGGAGVTMRFTMPDSADGMGLDGSLDVLVNGSPAQTVPLTSYYNYQYFTPGGGHPLDTPAGGDPLFRFDETHWTLATPLQPGDVIRIEKTNGDSLEYGVDFLEIEAVPAPRSRPANAVAVTDFGAIANDGQDDLAAFNQAVDAAAQNAQTLYIPEGTFHLDNMWVIGDVGNELGDITITGAGIWHTNIQFTNPNAASGGISFRVVGELDFSHVYMNSMLRSRYNQNAVYKAFMDNLGNNSRVHNVWVEHFECGFWVADYAHTPAIVTDNLLIEHSRIRNNLADGVNFAQGTSHSTVRNSSIRNNGDDGLAVWTSNVNGAPPGVNNTFTHNTIEFNWRAAGIAFFGGSGHEASYNLIVDGVGSSGFRMNTVFPGYHFQNNTGIVFRDSTIIRSGTSLDTWGGERGAIDLEASTDPIRNVTISNIDIYDTQRSAIQMGYNGGFENVVFNDIVIDGTGLDGVTTSRFSSPHPGAAIYTYTNNGTAVFNNLTTRNVAHPDTHFVQQGFNLIIQ